ncbi:NAD(P)-dependent oxidoreductase [Marinomonas atlantica]|uniref:NAD(P)-dependent oxidoreductase n=1 Tax=Marinomonas atlantica TaxID=1806668 RepID=UPI00082B8F50|nr:NAD(P)-dependent oxidoreductase [Marinomonas atlantica]
MKHKQVAFIGLGVMGFSIAGHLAQQGYRVTVYNRTVEKAKRWANEFSGHWAETPAEAAQGASVVCVCVGNDEDVRHVVYGAEGVLAGMSEGAVLIDHTTTSAVLAEELFDACQKQNVGFIDAPVSGGQAGAQNGALTIMCGGEGAVFESIKPVMECYAKQIQLLGVAGQGQRCKMVNQICIAGVLSGLSEALMLAEKAGLNIEQVVNSLQHGAAGSWQMSNRLETMSQGKFDFGFAIDWMRKDLGICLDQAKSYGIDLKMVEDVDQHYSVLQQRGLGRMDTSALVKAIAE